MKKSIESLINLKKVISFDLFDTLITRNLDNPTDLFNIIQSIIDNNNISLTNFKEKRIFSEKWLRKKGSAKKEVTLYDIYDFMEKQFNISKDILVIVQEFEIEVEQKICEINKTAWDIYTYALQAGKMIIIVTDMYLPRMVIENILKKNEIYYDKLYISCEENACKSDRGLFEILIKDLQINTAEILHIGDNKKSDYLVPKLKGIDSILIKNQLYNTILDKDVSSILYRFLLHFISNHLDMDNDYFYCLGYQTLGPILYGFSKWLNDRIQSNKYDKIFFLSRDGLIMQRAFCVINPSTSSQYLYASRQALITPTLWMYSNLSEVIEANYFSHHISIQIFLTKMGLEPIRYKQTVEKFGYKMEQYIDIYKEQYVSAFNLLWVSIYADIKANSIKEFDAMVQYFKHMEVTGNVAIVDIGWYGHMQLAIEKVLKAAHINARIEGYYVGVYPESPISEKIKMNGYICEKGKHELMRSQKRYFNSIFELTFTALHGSVKRYKNAAPEFLPYEYEGTNAPCKIKLIQEGALKFVKDYLEYGMDCYMNLDEDVLMTNFTKFGNAPTIKDVNKFSEFEFWDDEMKTIIPKYSTRYYLLHPNRLIKELKYSLWITGLLKKVLHININYYKLANFMRAMFYGKTKRNTN